MQRSPGFLFYFDVLFLNKHLSLYLFPLCHIFQLFVLTYDTIQNFKKVPIKLIIKQS